MPTNIEIKLRVDNLDAVEQKTASIAESGPETLIQEDVFFDVACGRLKLRKFASGKAELIAYHRSDSDQVRESKWLASPIEDPDSFQEAMGMTVGTGVTVRKHRTLYLVGDTRIHLDRVEGLGDFVEIEVVLQPEQDHDMGRTIANDLIKQIGLDDAKPISTAYADLIGSKMAT
jgi:predicted adenylyl cyclase CyaB